MSARPLLLLLSAAAAFAAPEWVLIRTTDGKSIEGQTSVRSIAIQSDGKPLQLKLSDLRSLHSAAPASSTETTAITQGLAAIQAADRKARDRAVEELTAIGIPAMTPLLRTLKDTDQHEPRPLYRLFERLMPSYADGFDRTLSLFRLRNGDAIRGVLPTGDLEVRTAAGSATKIPWSEIRTLAVRQRLVSRSTQVHSLRHCTQIEYLDAGLILSSASKLDSLARGFVRLSWDTDSWASDANGLTKPGAPSYKSNLVDGHPFGALVARSGSSGEVFFLGKKASKTGVTPGRLMLAVNDNRHWQNNLGAFYVTLTATDAYDLGDAQ